MKCEVAHNYIQGYAEDRIEAPLRVVLESHLSECSPCREELSHARELADLFRDLPKVEPPANFRAQVLERVAQQQRPRTWFGQWALPRERMRLPLAGAAAAAAFALLFTRATNFGGITQGPDVTLPTSYGLQAPSASQPELFVSGSGAPLNPLKAPVKLNLVIQPRKTLERGRVILADMTQGLSCETGGVATQRGKILWQGSLQAGESMTLPLELKASQPAVHRILLQIEGEEQGYLRMIFLPAFSEPQRMASDTLSGDRNMSDTLSELARHFGVVIVSDMARQRPQPTRIRLSLPGRAVSQVAAQRGLQWKVSKGVYNIYETESDKGFLPPP